MHKELRPYQKDDAAFLASLEAGGCFNEQRTGKTPTSLRACQMKGCRRILIVTTKSNLFSWRDACFEWSYFTGIVGRGTIKQRKNQIRIWQGMTQPAALVISYDSLKQTAKAPGCVSELLSAYPDGIILDEAHKIKNKGTLRTVALFHFIKIPFRLALTGTLAPGKSQDMWGTLHFLFPDRFPAYWPFIDEYYFTTKNINTSGQTYMDILYLKPNKERELQVFLSKVSTNRKRKDPEVMPWLPPVDHQKIRLPLTKEQLKYIRDLERIWETEGIVTKGVLDRLIRYRQICLAPALLELKGSSPKIEWVKDYINDYPECPTILFSKFTSFIHLLQKELGDVGVIVGATPDKQRDTLIKEFQSGKRNLLLLNIDATKEGVTLDRAEAIIFTDKYPPVGDVQQAEDRFVATTQDKADKPHVIYELMMAGSYDEHIYKLLDKRGSEVDVINSYKSYLERRPK